MTAEARNFECCPPFDPAPWDDKLLEWKDKLFVKDKVFTLFFMPVNFGSVMKRLDRKVEGNAAKILDWLCLSDHTSKWNMDVFLAVDKEIPSSEMVRLSGTFYSRVYEGNYSETGKWCADYGAKAAERGIEIEKMYMWYTTCPKCAKKYGKNYTVIISKIKSL
ncbi:MAG TPA: hydrolase [Paludibacter sp.]|nr:hydrolase [Paludibacter sp.]